VYLDHTRLWYSRGVEGDNTPAGYFEIADNANVSTYDENTNAFSFMSADGTVVVFRAKTRAEMNSWKSALEGRKKLTSENTIVYMADDHIAHYEESLSEDHFWSLSCLSGFHGTLCNR
jgi:hypothetical protein